MKRLSPEKNNFLILAVTPLWGVALEAAVEGTHHQVRHIHSKGVAVVVAVGENRHQG